MINNKESPRNNKFALMVIFLFSLSSLAAVTAAPIQKEGNSPSYIVSSEQPIDNVSQYSIDGTGISRL